MAWPVSFFPFSSTPKSNNLIPNSGSESSSSLPLFDGKYDMRTLGKHLIINMPNILPVNSRLNKTSCSGICLNLKWFLRAQLATTSLHDDQPSSSLSFWCCKKTTLHCCLSPQSGSQSLICNELIEQYAFQNLYPDTIMEHVRPTRFLNRVSNAMQFLMKLFSK